MPRNKERTNYLYVLPALLFMLLFIGYPIFYNIIMSFQNVDLMALNTGNKSFAGLKNYYSLFADKVFYKALYNTFIYTIFCLIFQFTAGFLLALFFNLDFKLSKLIRSLIMVAWLLPITATALNFKFMFGTDGGVINEILLLCRVIDKPVEWLLGQKSSMLSLIITNIWIGIPFNMILLVTGLSTIPKSIYESAAIDGAGAIQKIIYITLPLMKASITAVVTLGFINTFKVFDLVFIMTNGGPVNATEVLSTMSYRYSFDQFKFSMGATVANILFVILGLVSFIYIRYTGREDM